MKNEKSRRLFENNSFITLSVIYPSWMNLSIIIWKKFTCRMIKIYDNNINNN